MNMKKAINIFSRTSGLLCFGVTLFLASCSKSDSTDKLAPTGPATIMVTVADAVYESIDEVSTPGSGKIGSVNSAKNNEVGEKNLFQRQTVSFNKDYDLVAELQPEVTVVNKRPTSAALANTRDQSAIVRDNLLTGVQYKLAIYNAAGVYVTERDYIRGSEATAAPLLLDGGQTYNFIAYSINTSSAPPAIVFADINNRTLATSSTSTAGTSDFMYFKKTLAVSGDATNFLEVILVHKFSQITTILDASATGFNITAASSTISPNNTNSTSINLNDGVITRTGSISSATVNFPTLGAQILTSTPNILNSASINNGVYTIASLTVGTITNTNIIPFSNLAITPGVKYTMRVSLIPTDALITHQGLPAARINGRIWMRHNLGADLTSDPDASPMTVNRHGNFYQFGRLASVGSGTAQAMVSPNLSNAPPSAAWNFVETAPVKTVLDPCPAGYRVPTRTEQQQLINGTTVEANIGTFTTGPTEYSSAKVFRSRRNINVKLTFPAQGWFTVSGSAPYTPQPITSRGSFGGLWNSAVSNVDRTSYISFGSGVVTLTNRGSDNAANKVIAFNIRCTAE